MQNRTAIVISMLAGAYVCSAQPAQMETKTVTGIPYSAKAVTTSTETLADGTKITRTTTELFARDSHGRTRREQSTDSNEHIVFIRDPLAQRSYVLQPRQQAAVMASLVRSEDKRAAEMKDRQAQEIERTANESVAGRDGNKQVDDLGVRMIEGVKARGRRERQTIPIGTAGNDRPMQVVSEIWYSEELRAIVLSKRSDPRAGESEYRLTEISRAEPPRTLFEVPAGYSVREEGGRE
jgi:hypothetical protein